jgi:hypothetical protein
MLGPVLETLIGGLLTGVLYSLVALGFVLIFKASGVFNFAQGAMVLFAALSFALKIRPFKMSICGKRSGRSPKNTPSIGIGSKDTPAMSLTSASMSWRRKHA